MLKSTVIAAAAVLALGGVSTVAAGDISQVYGRGIYRPMNVMRHLKLATVYFNILDPWLPNKVDLAYAYRLGDAIGDTSTFKDLAAGLVSGDLHLAVPVDESSGYLTRIRAPCHTQADSRRSSADPGCVDWLKALRKERPGALRDFHVLADKELNAPGSARMVTWDRNEIVGCHFALPLSSHALPPR